MPGVAEIIFKYLLSSKDKKSLSETCKTMRRVFLSLYFPFNIIRPVKLSIHEYSESPSITTDEKCCSDGCSNIQRGAIMGMPEKEFGTIGMIGHCYKSGCKLSILKKSYHKLVKLLLLDNGNGYYVDPSDYFMILKRCCSKSSIRIKHDSIISGIFKRCISSERSFDINTVTDVACPTTYEELKMSTSTNWVSECHIEDCVNKDVLYVLL